MLIIVIMVLGLSGTSEATIVELDLLSLGCPTELNYDSTFWQTNFDLGVTFVEISHVYMDWSGSITAGLAIDYDNPDEPFPLQVGLLAYLEKPPNWHYAQVWGGEATYPNPEPFDVLSEIHALNWPDLLDGQSHIEIEYQEVGGIFGEYIKHGTITLDKAILRVEGTVPEPATLFLLGLGGLMLRSRKSLRS